MKLRTQQLARGKSRQQRQWRATVQCCSRPPQWPAKWSMLSLAAVLLLCHQLAPAQSTADPVAPVSSISKMLRSIQQSACDGEQLSIKCNDDYIIDVITAVHTILPEHNNQVKDTKVTKSLASWSSSEPTEGNQPTTTTCPPNTASSNDNNRLAEQAGAITTAQQPSTSGNATTVAAAAVCDEPLAQELALAKETVSTLVRTECHQRNSCTLDLRWPKLASSATGSEQAATTESTAAPVAQPAPVGNASQASTLKANGAKLSRLFNEPCPSNRKLVEIVYKCRPLKMNRRTACRGSQLELECPPQKVLVVASPSNYGAWANDTKNHERCSQEAAAIVNNNNAALNGEARMNPTTAAVGSNNSLVLAQRQPALMQHCLADSARVANVLGTNCLFQQSCKLDVTPQVFGTPNCPLGQVEYLKMIFTCVNETLIIAHNRTASASSSSSAAATSNSRARAMGGQLASTQQQQQSLERQRQQLDAPPFTSANITSSSLLSSSITANNVVVSAVEQQQQPLAPQLNALPSSVANGPGESQQDQQQQRQQQLLLSEQAFTRSPTQLEGPVNNRVYTIVAADPQLSVVSPVHWTAGQRIRYLLKSYQNQLFMMGLLALSVIMSAFAIRSCRSRSGDSRNSTTSSKDSKDSACSTKSSTGFKSLGSSSSSSAAGGIGGGTGSGSGASKHNSCSESCFSLDDYNPQQGNHQSAANSPALPGNSTTFDGAHHQQQHHHDLVQGARPKLWTIYGAGVGEQHQQRVSNVPPHHTMRPTRTFVSQQQQQHIRNAGQCFHQLLIPNTAQATGAGSARGSVSNAADLLLAMANQQQQQQHQQVAWCATLGHQQHLLQQQHHQMPSPADRLALLMAPAGAEMLQNQQQQMIFPPPATTLQLEPPQASGALIAPQQPFTSQQQPFPSQQAQQQQQQPAQYEQQQQLCCSNQRRRVDQLN